MKYQYLKAEQQSIMMLPINLLYTFEAVSNPITAYNILWDKLPVTVQGTVITLVSQLFFKK